MNLKKLQNVVRYLDKKFKRQILFSHLITEELSTDAGKYIFFTNVFKIENLVEKMKLFKNNIVLTEDQYNELYNYSAKSDSPAFYGKMAQSINCWRI